MSQQLLPTKANLAFSYGPHSCIGGSLARLTLKVVFGSIFQRIPALRLAVAPEELKLRKKIVTDGLEEFRRSGDVRTPPRDRDRLRDFPARLPRTG
ncbi:cytochrome P450 [Bradyrhizobium sp. USDA 4472]